MRRSPTPLVDVLRTVFRANDELLEYLARLDYANAADLVDNLPSTNVPKSTFAFQAGQQIQAHGLDTPGLFHALTEKFPGQRSLIEASEHSYFSKTPPQPDKSSDAGTETPGGVVPVELALTYEKIMGDRPTFLDVSYLAVGYQRAKSVAKLRMCFADGWYAGTAFLVAPDTLLTAHHNLWTKGKRAEKVEVILDYERSADGPEFEGIMLAADPETFSGDADDDWAVLKLDEAQVNRPLAPLSAKPAIEGDRVAIIQHPGGMLKQVALHHNLVTYADETKIQYLTDTQPGSSGSPVFNGAWEVVGLHQMGGTLALPGTERTVYRNQGTAIQRILQGLAAKGIASPN